LIAGALRRGFKRGIQGGGVKDRAASQGLELGSAGQMDAMKIDGGIGGEKKGMTVGARVSATEKRKGANGEMHKLEDKAPFGECTKGSRADWAEWRGGGLWAKRVGAGSTVPDGLDPRSDSKMK
jgi:hypothetical protein